MKIFKLDKLWVKILAAVIALIVILYVVSVGLSYLIYGRSLAATVNEYRYRHSNVNSIYVDEKSVQETLNDRKTSNTGKYIMKDSVAFSVSVREDTINSTQVYILNDTGENDKAVIYIHGGAYINEPSKTTWEFADKIASETGAEVIVPIYSLAPVYTYEKAYDEIENVLNSVVSGFAYDDITIMGDSSGGGLAAGFCEYIGTLGRLQPGNLILISPWVDGTLSNENIKDYEDVDPLLCVYGLKKYAEAWAGNTPVEDYRISPVNGDLACLKNVYIFTGTREIFYPDNVLFYNKLVDAGVNAQLIRGTGLDHCWPVQDIPEAEKAISKITEVIKGTAE